MSANQKMSCCLLAILSAAFLSATHAAEQSVEQVVSAMRQAAEFYTTKVSSHGGYVYHYSLDLQQRWGEGEATQDQVWVQPPGTPTVGMALLRAYQATGESLYLKAASNTGKALVKGQLKSGGWTNVIDFDPKGRRVAQYLRGGKRGKNNSSLDDGQTQSAILCLIHLDSALQFQDQTIHKAVMIALESLLAAQFPNGGFPQVWTRPVEQRPIVKASYPNYDWRTEGRIKQYWDMYTLNDNVTGYVAEVLIAAYETYGDDQYATALRRLGDFLLLSQIPEPQPGWAQQYNVDMQPIWARKFEPPAVASDETQEVIQTLMTIAQATGDEKYLAPIPSAIAWLGRSRLPDGQFARFYELRSNRPLFMKRQGDRYELTYTDANLPTHYGWKSASQLPKLEQMYDRVRSGQAPSSERSRTQLSQEVRDIVAALDAEGRWVSYFDGMPKIGQLKLPLGTPYLSSEVFSEHLTLLADFVSAADE
ncbi:MAG: pectate lyase [Rubripirellula sp.]